MQRRDRGKFVVVLVTIFVYRATSNMLQTSIPLYTKYVLFASDLVVSLVVGLASIAALLSLFFFGLRKVNVGRGILVSLAMTCISLPLLLVAFNTISLTLIYSAINFWSGSLLTLLLTAAVLVSDDENRQRNITIFSAALSLSLVLGPVYQAFVLVLARDNLAYSMTLFTPVLAMATLLFFFIGAENKLSLTSKLELRFIRNKPYWIGILAFESFTIPFIALLTFGGIFEKNNFGASYAQIELIFTAFFSTSLIVRLMMVRLSVSRHILLMGSFASTVIGLVLVSASSNLIETTLGFVLLGYSHGVYVPVGANLVVKNVPKEGLVGANTVSALIDSAIFLVATPLLGVVAQNFGLRVLFVASSVPVIAIGIGYSILSRQVSRKVGLKVTNEATGVNV